MIKTAFSKHHGEIDLTVMQLIDRFSPGLIINFDSHVICNVCNSGRDVIYIRTAVLCTARCGAARRLIIGRVTISGRTLISAIKEKLV